MNFLSYERRLTETEIFFTLSPFASDVGVKKAFISADYWHADVVIKRHLGHTTFSQLSTMRKDHTETILHILHTCSRKQTVF